MSMLLRVLLLALLLSACAGEQTTAEEDGGGEGEQDSGPLAEFFGYDEQFDSGQFADQERRVQELIVACMAEEGFEYRPVEYPDPGEDPVLAAQQELSGEQYAAEYGYGATAQQESTPVEEEFVDPNAELLEGMTESERQAYDLAMYGEPIEVAPGEEETGSYGFGGGCQGSASEEVYGGDTAMDEELGPKYEELYQRIEADPRIIDGTAAWSECMAEAGYDFARQEDAPNSIYEQLEELYNALPVPSEAPDGEDLEMPQIDEAAMAELREEEIAVAVADQRCAAEHLPEDLRREVSAEYEQAFIDENRELLERARDAMPG